MGLASQKTSNHAEQQPVGSGETDHSRGQRRNSRRPLNILRIATDLYPDITGGGAIHAHAMSKQQAARGHSVTVLTSDHGDSSRPVVEAVDGYTVRRNRELARPFGNSITPGILASLRERIYEADIVHAHSHLYFASNIAAAIKQFSETPLVVTNHGLMSQTAPKWVQRMFIPTVARFTFQSADRILCYTETDRQRLQDRGVSSSINVINNGIDCQQFSPPATERRPKRLLFVGRLTDVKGVPVLLSAFERLAQQYPDVELRIVGDGPRRSVYEKRCRELGVEQRVEFTGDVPYEEMAQHYHQSRVFVLPSKNEGLPRTVLEAMACETPVVTTSLPQLEPVVDGAGYTVQQASATELTERISELLDNDELCHSLGEAGREQVVDENSWEETVEHTTDVYYDLL